MGKIDYEFKESGFTKKYSDTYDLSILIGVDRFSFLVSDPQQNVLLLRSYTYDQSVNVLGNLSEPLKSIYINDEYIKYTYRQTKIGLLQQKSTLVPSDLFEANQKKDYLSNVVEHLAGDTIVFDQLKPLAAVNVYATNTTLLNQLYGYFPSAKICHASSALLLGHRTIAENRTGRQLCLNVREGLLQISLFDNKELLFFNSFLYLSSRDFIYYVMLIFDQFNLKPEGNTVHISGHIVQDSEIYHLLFRYIRHLEMLPIPSYYRMGKKGTNFPDHFFFDLYSLMLCE